MNVWTKISFHLVKVEMLSLDRWQPAGGATWKVGGSSQKSAWFILWESWISVQNFKVIHPTVVEILQWWSGFFLRQREMISSVIKHNVSLSSDGVEWTRVCISSGINISRPPGENISGGKREKEKRKQVSWQALAPLVGWQLLSL